MRLAVGTRIFLAVEVETWQLAVRIMLWPVVWWQSLLCLSR